MPVQHGPWWYVTRTVAGESYQVFCRGTSIDTADDVILDCNVEAQGHDYFDVHAVEPSPDHSLLAWSSDLDGGEVYTLRVRDLTTGRDLADALAGTSSWGGVAWSADGQWLFYARPDEQMRPHEIWRHRLGIPGDRRRPRRSPNPTSGSASTSRRRAASGGSSSRPTAGRRRRSR